MDAVQQQIIALSHKVDTLYQMIDQLSQNVSESLSEIRRTSVEESHHSGLTPSVRVAVQRNPSLLESVMEHKDVLMDSNTQSSNYQQNSESSLSADIQVQRLTAQLTAAYNRIAALEEQLLSRRIHS